MLTAWPYWGAKTRIAPEIWKRFGNPKWYFEPFGGALGCLLNRPEIGRYEMVGDADCLIINFYRAVCLGGVDEVARYADWPSGSVDLVARFRFLSREEPRLHKLLTDDPRAYDAETAGYFAYVLSNRHGTQGESLNLWRGAGTARKAAYVDYLHQLRDRMRGVRIYYGDWKRSAKSALLNSATESTAILCDPPYGTETGRQSNLYRVDRDNLARRVAEWARQAARLRPRLRIALAGMPNEHEMPGWSFIEWNTNSKTREWIWFSPSCLSAEMAEPRRRMRRPR